MAQRRNMRRSPERSAHEESDYGERGRYGRASRSDEPRDRRYGRTSQAPSRSESYDVRPLSLRTIAIIVSVVALACVLIIFVAVPLINADRKATEDGLRHVANEVKTLTAVEAAASDFAVSANAQSHDAYTPTVQDVLGIPQSKNVTTLDLSQGQSAQAGNDVALGRVRSAIAAIEELGDCGFVFIDMGTGRGLAYNVGQVMYVASAAKAPFVYWLLTSKVGLDEWERQSADWIITESDNESFEELFANYYDSDYATMMEAHGVPENDYSGNYYPNMSAKSLAALWVEMQAFMQSGSPDAQWLADLLASTSTSFIRDGLEGTDAVVINKAGWISEDGGYYSEDSDEAIAYESVTDAGLISVDGQVYLMAIVTNQPDGDTSEQGVRDLARALFDARSTL